MRITTRVGALTAGAFLALAATLGGCSATTTTPGASATPSPSATPLTPKEALDAAVDEIATDSFAYMSKGDGNTFSGVVDPKNKAMNYVMEMKIPEAGVSMKMSFVVIEKKVWFKISGVQGVPGMTNLPKKWMLLDPTKITESMEIPYEVGDGDPLVIDSLISGMIDPKMVGTGKYTGTVDLTAVTDIQIVDDITVKDLGAKAKAIPAEVTVNSAGKLTRLSLKMPAGGNLSTAYTHVVTIDKYGSAPPVTAPAASETTVATPAVYEFLTPG